MIWLRRWARPSVLGRLALLALVLSVAGAGAKALGANLLAVQASRALAGPISRHGDHSPTDPEAAYWRGLSAQQAGDPAEAEAAWTLALRGGPRYVALIAAAAPASAPLARLAAGLYADNFRAWAWLGDATASADPAAAVAYYQRATALEPHANLAWEKLASLAAAQDQPGLAASAARQACALNPTRNGSCHAAARLAYTAGDWAAVLRYFELGDDPEHAEDWARLIRAAWHLGLEAQAQAYTAQAQTEDPGNYPTLLELLH